jgi:hypothetical protein
MNCRFLPLFTFRITHQYYGGDDVTCPDFNFVLAEHSQRALAGARMLARVNAGQLHILFEADESNSPAQAIDGLELIIGLRLSNPHFEYFTAALPDPLPLYANASTSKTLDAPQASDLIAHRFSPSPATTQRPLTLSIHRMRGNALVWSGEIGDGESMPIIDMRSWEAGCYLVTQQSGTESHTRPLILAPDLAEAGMWGILRITVTTDFWNSPPPPDFQVGFSAREETLDYFVVAPTTWSDFEKLSVTDASQLPTLTFKKLVQTISSADGISPVLLGLPDAQAVLFRSNFTVARSAASSLHLQLNRNGDTLVKNLPLPSASMPSARFVVHLSKP